MNNDFPILVAEDNAASRRLLEKILAKAGYEVVTTENGRLALELFKERFFPIVLSDWMMPEMNGFELCKAIRENSKGYVFIILLTSKDTTNDIVTGFEAGADDYLTKPVNYAELIARIKTGMRIIELERSLIKANEEIKALSIIDPLTGIYNRRYLLDKLPDEIKRSERYDHNLSMILCDIDHFKSINDNYGHLEGDYVLREFTACLKKSIRDNLDWISRYGGEEFIIVLPETDLEGARVLAERLRIAVSQRTMRLQKKDINITASFGVTCFEGNNNNDNITVETLIKKSDDLLYQAKLEGRDMVKCGLLK